jgi:predicted AlkP superfamily pyrophosphatase or phosphodiesterase
MNKLIRIVQTLLLLCLPVGAAVRPKLVVVIAIDQFRYDYLTRFRGDYSGGLDRLLKHGAVMTNAHLQHFPTVTAVGHSTILTGAPPFLSGIAGNEWYDRESGKRVTSVSDAGVQRLGAVSGAGASPHRLLVSTVADELKMSGRGESRVIGMSLKDRSAILTVGRMADAAYWFDSASGSFVSSTWYFPELPAWVREFNASGALSQYTGAEWKPSIASGNGAPFLKLPSVIGPAYFQAVQASPFGNDVVEQLAERAIEAERLGARGATDLLAFSFSSNDHVGHEVGPDSPLVRDISIHTDQTLDRFFRFLGGKLGLEYVLVVLTADHGVAPVPEENAMRRMPSGRMREATLNTAANQSLAARYGPGRWILDSVYGAYYLNEALILERKLNLAEVQRTLAAALRKVPGVARVYTREQLVNGQFEPDPIGRCVANGFHPRRSGDVITLLEPYWIYGNEGTSHGSVYSYDTHLPLIFMGPGIKPGVYNQNVAINDIAPTLATILEVETPSGSTGRVLDQIIQ